MKYKRYQLIPLFVFLMMGQMMAQQEEVRVVKPYTPTLTGAEKIQLLPDLGDSVEYEMPAFEYSLFPKRYETGFRVTPIQPARMVKMPLDKIYKSQLTLGAGNYLTPLAELRINQIRASKGTFGVGLKHHSMNGAVRRENGQKMDAGFNENSFSLYGKRFSGYTIFEYKAGADYNTNLHYGVDTALIDSVTIPDLLHRYYNAYAGLGFGSARPDSFHLNYKGTLDYYFFSHELEQMEHGAVLDASLEQIVRDFRVGGDIGVEYYGHPVSWDTLLTNQFMIRVNPYVTKSSDEWMFRIGLNSSTEIRNGKVDPHLYISGKFSFNIVKEVLVPYFGVDGYRESSNYRAITMENPFIVPDLVVEPVNTKLIVYAGLKGKISDNLAWNLKGSYSSVDNQYFFATDTLNDLHHEFVVIYDDMTVARVGAELNIRPASSLKFVATGNYYNYQMSRELHAWYKPGFDAGLQARYNLEEKILVSAGLFVIGPRYYPSLTAGGDPGKLKTSVDLNLGAEYRYTELLSFWLKFNNMTAQPYYLWNNYPSYRFRCMIGFTYGL